MQFDIARGCAHEPLKRRAVPEHFFDRRGKQFGPGAQEGKLIGVGGQAKQRVVNQVGGGFLSADEKQLEESEQVGVGEALAVDLGVNEPGEQVVGGMGTAFENQVDQIIAHLV